MGTMGSLAVKCHERVIESRFVLNRKRTCHAIFSTYNQGEWADLEAPKKVPFEFFVVPDLAVLRFELGTTLCCEVGRSRLRFRLSQSSSVSRLVHVQRDRLRTSRGRFNRLFGPI